MAQRSCAGCIAPGRSTSPRTASSGPARRRRSAPRHIQAALGEVRQISDTRTAEQLAIATYWNLQQSGRRNAPFNNKAVELIRKYHIQDAEAARIMFLMSSAVFDGSIGCFDAKYHYWFIRPPQADPAHHPPDRVAEPPILSLGAFVRLRVGERRADGVFPRRCG